MNGIEMVLPIVAMIFVLGIAFVFFMAMKKQIDIRMRIKERNKIKE